MLFTSLTKSCSPAMVTFLPQDPTPAKITFGNCFPRNFGGFASFRKRRGSPVFCFLLRHYGWGLCIRVCPLLPHLSLKWVWKPSSDFFFVIHLKNRSNSHTVKRTHLKYTIQWVFSIFIRLCGHHHYFQDILITPKRNAVPTSGHPLILHPSTARQSLIYSLSLWVCLLRIFHIEGIIPYVTFFVCLL